MLEGNDHWKTNEDDEDIDETGYIEQKDAILFAIEVSEHMLSCNSNAADSPLASAIKCAYQIMQQRIISSPNNMMGVLLFGTEKSNFEGESGNRVAFPHCYVLINLNIPSAEDIKTLRSVAENREEQRELLIPSSTPVSMSNMLFCVNQIFTSRAPTFGSRRLFIITDRDDPHGSDKNTKSQAAIRAKDLYDLGISIELFPICHPEQAFDCTKFYDDIIYRDPNEELAGLVSPPRSHKSTGSVGLSLLNSLISDINSKEVAKRALIAHLPFEIGPGLTITVKSYNVLQKQQPARSCFVWESGEELQIATSETKIISEDSTNEIPKTEITKAYKFGGSYVYFTPDEQKKLKFFESPVLRIIGFKPQSMLPLWASVKKSTFIYPTEEDYVGSTRVFSALWQKLLKSQMMGIAWYIARVNAAPLQVAILPSAECHDPSTGIPSSAAGLWLYTLPFADDLRPLPPLPPPLVAPEILTDEMGIIIKQLQLPNAIYDHRRYPNPALQWHYKVLQAIALEDEVTNLEKTDKTIPRYRQIDNRVGKYVHNWGLLLEKHYSAWRKKVENTDINQTVTKRISEDVDAGKKKRAKTNGISLESMNKSTINSLIRNGVLESYTIADLKFVLKNNGLSTTGKKPDLVDRLEKWAEGK